MCSRASYPGPSPNIVSVAVYVSVDALWFIISLCICMYSCLMILPGRTPTWLDLTHRGSWVGARVGFGPDKVELGVGHLRRNFHVYVFVNFPGRNWTILSGVAVELHEMVWLFIF